tara:strand:+ start:184 stop:960 length:777 start_codon:yes stop_codon:yes gene_type:complete
MTDQGRLHGKVALITGAGSGIGKETALRFASEGAQVACADLVGERATETADQIGGDALGLELDVTSGSSISNGLERLLAQFGGVDCVINNAGVTIVGAAHEMPEDEWDKELDTNLKSVYLVSKAVWPHLVERGGGSITSTASIAGIWAIPADAAYCASKAGVVMLTKCMALDGAKVGIRVNCICPGFTETPMIEGYFNDQPNPDESRKFATSIHPLGRLGKPRDIADGFVYLSSDEASWITGTPLVIDGGLISGIWAG